ncbi:PREDICTED: ADP-ribosylation factor-like isoform X1 [Branchiostoma belcheri]|uniref:ADP-ribosylation factor-like protein 14 n=1 Tax=Branchiostoma belcheri TaxID=7741 RepID=A0A6P4YPV9_BRABE|nr:PREDICTED: ADP-ribosylation factor-like isoform X1 [Branchiostoma belcheri]
MGLYMGKLIAKLYGQQEVRILMLGLDCAGKTTILYRLMKSGLGEVRDCTACAHSTSLGFNVETIEYKNVKFTSWDVGGRDKARPLWRHYYPNTDAIIFVLDSSDRERLPEMREEIGRYLHEDELRDSLFLILANKQDLPNALPPDVIREKLELDTLLRGRQWHLQPASAREGQGLYEGLDWLTAKLANKEAHKYVTQSVVEARTDAEALTKSNPIKSVVRYFKSWWSNVGQAMAT